MLFIDAILFSLYQTSPELNNDLREKAAIAIINRKNLNIDQDDLILKIEEKKSTLINREIADHSFPHFISQGLPKGVAGLLIAAIMAAAMSTISTCLNSSATVLYSDFYKRIRPDINEKKILLQGH